MIKTFIINHTKSQPKEHVQSLQKMLINLKSQATEPIKHESKILTMRSTFEWILRGCNWLILFTFARLELPFFILGASEPHEYMTWFSWRLGSLSCTCFTTE